MNEKEIKSYKVIMRKDQLVQFLGMLHEKQMEMIDLAVEKSDLKDAKQILDRIRNL